MVSRNNRMKVQVDQKVLDAIRTNATAIADVEASERSQRTIADDENDQGAANSTPSQDQSTNQDQSTCKPFRSVRQRLSQLPTVHEVSGVASASSQSSSDDDMELVKMKREEVLQLNDKAADHALRGNEAMAIKLYKRSLTIATEEVGRIQRRMEKAKAEPEYLKDTIYHLLGDEWTEMVLIIANTKTMMAVIYERTGDYERAIKTCKEARDVYERQLRKDSNHQSENFSEAKKNYAMMTHMADKLDEAAKTYELRRELHEEAIAIYEKLKTAKKPSVREMMFEGAFDKISAALSIELQNLGKNHPQVSETLSFLSKLHLAKNDKQKALLAMERSASVAEIALGTQHPRTGQKFYDLARQYECADRDKYDKAHAALFYEKALDIYKEAEGDHCRTIGSISNDLGVLHIQQSRPDQAIKHLNDALAMYESSNERFDATSAETAQVWRNLAECYILQKEWEMAIINFSCALEAQRDARKLYDSEIANYSLADVPPLIRDENIADTMKRLGKAYAAKHEYDKAYGVLLEALTIFQNACGKSKANVKKFSSYDLASKQDQIASVIYCLAEIKEATSKNEEALKLYEEALQLRLHSDKIKQRDQKSNHVHIAMSLAGIGNMRMAKGEYSMAFKAFNEAIQSARQQELPEYHPIVQMLWARSRKAAQRMSGEEDSAMKSGVTNTESSDPGMCKGINTDDGVNGESKKTSAEIEREFGVCARVNTWSQTASNLEKKAKLKKERGDIDGAIEDAKHILEFRRAYAAKRVEGRKSVSKIRQEIAQTLVELARLWLIKEDVGEAGELFREAMDLYKSIGLSKHSDCVQEIKRELDRLKWQNKVSGRGRSCTKLR